MNASDYKAVVLFDKQVEFFDKLIPILHEVNCYIATLDVLSGEAGKAAKKQFKIALKKTSCCIELGTLLDQYYFYVPEDLSNEANELQFQCMMLEHSLQTSDAAVACIKLLFALQENIRKFVQRIPPVMGGG